MGTAHTSREEEERSRLGWHQVLLMLTKEVEAEEVAPTDAESKGGEAGGEGEASGSADAADDWRAMLARHTLRREAAPRQCTECSNSEREKREERVVGGHRGEAKV